MYNVIVVATTKAGRQSLTEHFFRRLKPRYKKCRIYRATSAEDAQAKIDRHVPLYPDLVVFSHEVTREEKDQLREYLTDLHLATTFVTVPADIIA